MTQKANAQWEADQAAAYAAERAWYAAPHPESQPVELMFGYDEFQVDFTPGHPGIDGIMASVPGACFSMDAGCWVIPMRSHVELMPALHRAEALLTRGCVVSK